MKMSNVINKRNLSSNNAICTGLRRYRLLPKCFIHAIWHSYPSNVIVCCHLAEWTNSVRPVSQVMNYVVAYLNKVNVQRNKFNLISIDVWH